MNDIVTDLETVLHQFPGVRLETEGRTVVVRSPGEGRFTVGMEQDADDITVFYEGWHAHIPKKESRAVLCCFLTGLSEACRLKVFRRGNKDYKWVCELRDDKGQWFEAGMMLLPLAALALWREKSVRYLQNTAITLSQFDALFPQARTCGTEAPAAAP